MNDLVEYALRLGDDALICAQRLAEWCSRAPEMEEDVALANIALDQLGAARLFLTHAGELEGAGRDEDALAFLRTDREYRNCLLVELPGGDFAVTMTRLLLLTQYQFLLYDSLVSTGTERLADIAAKLRKESAYHVDHSSLWTVRLGDGTSESHRRMQAALVELWPYTHELFETDPVYQRLDEAGLATSPATLHDEWLSRVDSVLDEATLAKPADGWRPTGGRSGLHTEHLSYLLAEMQVLHRAHPGARW